MMLCGGAVYRWQLEPSLCFQSRDGRVRDPEGAGDVCQCVASVDPGYGLALLILVQSRVPAHMDATCLRAYATFTGPDFDQLALELSQTSEDGEQSYA